MNDTDFEAHNRPSSHLAEATASALTTHERICAERYQGIIDRISRLEWVMMICAGALISGMAGLIVTLALRHP